MAIARLRSAVCAALLLVGCTTPKKDGGPTRPVHFAVIAAPEIGSDDTDLLLAVTKLSLEPQLDFVLVPGPLLATDANATSLDLLKNALGQIAPPVYVSFAAVVSPGTSTLKGEEILGALEKAGPGTEHAVTYTRTPPRAPSILVNAISPDGTGAVEELPEDKRVVRLGVARHGVADIAVAVAAEKTSLEAPALLYVPPLGKARQIVFATIYPRSLEAQPVSLEGPNPPPLAPVPLPVR